jgi:hypothetical protein
MIARSSTAALGRLGKRKKRSSTLLGLEHGAGAERRDACLAAEGGMREESLRQSPFMCSRRFFSTSFLSILHPPPLLCRRLFIFPDWCGTEADQDSGGEYELWRLDGGVLLIYPGAGGGCSALLLASRMDDAQRCGSGRKVPSPAISAVRCRRIDGRIRLSTPSARVAMRVGPTRVPLSPFLCSKFFPDFRVGIGGTDGEQEPRFHGRSLTTIGNFRGYYYTFFLRERLLLYLHTVSAR